MIFLEIIYKILCCHALGDYFFQIDFIAKTKHDNLWHLLMHCFLYSVPFALCFGIDYKIIVILLSHLTIDYFTKPKNDKFEDKIIYALDQIGHLVVAFTVYISL